MSEAAAVVATPSDHAPATPLTSLRVSFAAGGVAAAAEAAIVVPFLGRYGWDRDELYFLSAAHRPTWGYVDFPPVTAWIGWAVHALFGDSLDALRLTSLAAMLAATILVALMARELGGGARTQAAAAFIWALSPYGLAAASIFHPTWFDALCWVALLYVLLLALGVVFRWRNPKAARSAWHHAADATSSAAKTAADKAASAASAAADEVKGVVPQ